ncbi:MAG TPA: ComEA family DNA-binding protein [Candidatus Brocadiia bacterium]|nr:helix-hairpin-helix domain-containing protein [Candidatus Brocadiales bacterium]
MESETNLTPKSPLKLFPFAKFSRKELIVIFSLCITLSIGIVSKYVIDYHWITPDIEVISPQNGSQRINFQLDINKAEWYELVLLPEVGEVRAKAIVAYRNEYGKFQDIKELLNVKGMNGSVIEAIRDYILVGSRE